MTLTPFTKRRPRSDRRYLSSQEAADFLGYKTLHAFICAYPKLGIQPYRLGRMLRFLEEDLEAALAHATVVPATKKQA